MNKELRSKLFTALMHGVLEADIKEFGEMAASDLDAIEPILKEHFTAPERLLAEYEHAVDQTSYPQIEPLAKMASFQQLQAEAAIGRWYLERMKQ